MIGSFSTSFVMVFDDSLLLVNSNFLKNAIISYWWLTSMLCFFSKSHNCCKIWNTQRSNFEFITIIRHNNIWANVNAISKKTIIWQYFAQHIECHSDGHILFITCYTEWVQRRKKRGFCSSKLDVESIKSSSPAWVAYIIERLKLLN